MLRSRRRGPAALTALALGTVGIGTLAGAVASPASAASSAAFTTTNAAVDGDGHCFNGPATGDPVNCNIYDVKQSVWLNGGPATAALGDGTYFFAVLAPGGQADPNDGTPKNLSDGVNGDYLTRTFTASDGTISYAGPRDFANNRIRLFPYDDTPNPGGVYTLAVCQYGPGAQTVPVDPSSCKYDAFKVLEDDVDTDGDPEPVAPTVTKDAAGSYTTTWNWEIDKAVDRTVVKQVGGSADFAYTVAVSHDGGNDSDVAVTGTITAFNANLDGTDVVPVRGVNVTDSLSDGTLCAVDGGTDAVLAGAETTFAYTCELDAVPDPGVHNTASIEWPEQILDNGALLPAGSATFSFPTVQDATVAFAQTKVDDCVSLTDAFGVAGSAPVGVALDPASVCQDQTSPIEIDYTRSIPVPRFGCLTYDDTATFVANTTEATGSDSASVQVCGPLETGAHTIGFWQNKNGQALITGGASTAGVCNSATWLRQYKPFQDLAANATCKTVGSYVTGVIKAVNTGGATLNPQLKAQMLATSLDVYFTDPALGGNKLKASAPLGGRTIDLTKICSDVGNCTGFTTTSAAFDGFASRTVQQLLTYAASQSIAGGSTWYAQHRATQELAKDTFDAINNQVVFAP